MKNKCYCGHTNYCDCIPKDCLDCSQNLEECNCIKDTIHMKSYTELEVEELIYNICGTAARLQNIILNGEYIDIAYKQHKKK